jgi:hypothetical protein
MPDVHREEFFHIKSGELHFRIRRTLNYLAEWPELYGPISTVDDLKRACDAGKVQPQDIFQLRGMGNARSPGKLALYLFPQLKSYEKVKRERIENNLGWGI